MLIDIGGDFLFFNESGDLVVLNRILDFELLQIVQRREPL